MFCLWIVTEYFHLNFSESEYLESTFILNLWISVFMLQIIQSNVQVNSFSCSRRKVGQRHTAHLCEETWLRANLQSIGCKQLILPLCFVSFQRIEESKKITHPGDKTHFTEERYISVMIKKNHIKNLQLCSIW